MRTELFATHVIRFSPRVTMKKKKKRKQNTNARGKEILRKNKADCRKNTKNRLELLFREAIDIINNIKLIISHSIGFSENPSFIPMYKEVICQMRVFCPPVGKKITFSSI